MSLTSHGWKRFAIGLCEAALLLTLLFSIVTVFGQLHRNFDLFSHFRFQYFITSVLLTLVFVALRWRGYVWLGVLAVAVNGYFVVPWFLSLDEAVANDNATVAPIKLVHANVLHTNDDANRLMALVRDEQPDLIVLQEATPKWISMLYPIEPSYPYTLIEARGDQFGIALYSKFPLDSTAIIESVPLGFPDLIATAIVGGKRLNIISTHPIPPVGVGRYAARNLQLDSVAKLAARTPDPVIVVGDLNITMWGHHYGRLEEISGLRNARRGFGIEPTWPLFFLPALIPIDHCLVSDGIHVVDFRTGPQIGSDHLPIVVSMVLAN